MFTPVNHRRLGSALLITLLMMGVLTLFGLGLGTLLVREIRVQAEALRAAQALYAAEGAVERGLLERVSHAVGYSIGTDDAVSYDYDNDTESLYTITATTDVSVPCTFEYNRVGADSDGYQPVEPEQTVRLPLFYEDESGDIISSNEWKLSYFGDQGASFRWKLFGLTSKGYTEAMNQVVTVSATVNTLSSADYYGDYENTAADGTSFSYTEDFMKTFLDDHTYPYLVLTNLSPAGTQSASFSFRLDATGNLPLPCEYARVSGDGVSSFFSVQQSIDALIRVDTVLPILDFVLYQLGDEPLILTIVPVVTIFTP